MNVDLEDAYGVNWYAVEIPPQLVDLIVGVVIISKMVTVSLLFIFVVVFSVL